METIITAATVLSMFMNLSNDVNAPYYYNADVENNQVKTLYVYNDNEGQLSERLEYHYTYDEQGRLTSKVAYRHDAITGKNEPDFKLDYTYYEDGYTVAHSEWNGQAKDFDTANSMTEYVKKMDNLMAITNYKWDEEKADMLVTDKFLVMGAHNDFLLAGM